MNTIIPNSVTSIGKIAFSGCSGLTSITIPNNVTTIESNAFWECTNLTSISFPNSVTSIGSGAFADCWNLATVIIGNGVTNIGDGAFISCSSLTDMYLYAEQVPETGDNVFEYSNYNATLHVPATSVSAYQATEPWKNFKEIVALPNQASQDEYRPFVEDNKVWAVKVVSDGWPTEEYYEYYYFDGDTIVNGQTAKRMLCDRIGSSWDTSGEYVGSWYEQDKKVYYAGKRDQQFELLYDFTLSTDDNIQIQDRVLQVTKMSGGIPGFKGTHYDLKYDYETTIKYDYETSIVERWLEGVGSEYYPWLNLCAGWAGAGVGLLVCKAGDEIIYYNSEENDPYSMGARKRRIDFTQTIKTQPQSRMRSEEKSLYGEYNDQQLCINLDPLDDTYLVNITDESGKTVYEKDINAGSIVGLNIDISNYAKGRYTVTVENSSESFTGEFGADNADANGDGEVNVADVDYVIEHIGEALDETNKAADVNDDGEINVADVDYIIERIV